MSRSVTFSDEVQSLINNSNTHPSVLVAKLLTDAWARKYDDKASDLLRRREILSKELTNAVMFATAGPKLSFFWNSGAAITVQFGRPCPYSPCLGSNDKATEFFKSLSSYSPRQTYDGLHRLLSLKIFNTGPAAYLWAHVQHQYDSDTEFRQQLTSYRKPWNLSREQMTFGLGGTTLSFQNKEPQVPAGYVQGGLVHVDLRNIGDEGLADTFYALCEEEATLLREMMKDANLLADRAFKVRSLEKAIKKIPDVLEHPDFKLLLGYDVNPQQDRIDFVNRTLTGEALLNPSL